MYQLLNKKRNKKGFTLIELIVVIAILAILAAILIPRFVGFQDKARRTQVIMDAKQIATAIDSLIAETTGGAITAVGTLAVPVAVPSGDPVVKLSGVDASRINLIGYEATGAFIIKEEINGTTYSGGRSTSSAAVTVTP